MLMKNQPKYNPKPTNLRATQFKELEPVAEPKPKAKKKSKKKKSEG